MKKLLSLLTAVFFSLFAVCSLYAQSLPDELSGLWEGDDRFIFFDDANPGELVIVLKTYYGWYLNRASEPESYAESFPRDRNTANTKVPEHVLFTLETLNSTNTWEMKIDYSKHEQKFIPFALIDDKIYLDFYVHNGESWYGNASSQGFTLDYHPVDENIGTLIFDGDKYFDIRYWLTDMELCSDKAFFSYEGKEYSVLKHVVSAGHLYTCARGRSKVVRNIVPPVLYNEEDFIYNSDKTVLVNVKSVKPYLKKVQDKKTVEQLMQLVQLNNSRRKPDPAPLFPVPDLGERQQPINWRAKGLPENFGE